MEHPGDISIPEHMLKDFENIGFDPDEAALIKVDRERLDEAIDALEKGIEPFIKYTGDEQKDMRQALWSMRVTMNHVVGSLKEILEGE